MKYTIAIKSKDRPLVTIDNYDVAPNGVTFLFGESGIGKSLLSNTIYGLVDPGDLSISINGEDYLNYIKDERTQDLQKSSFFVFQEPSSHLNPLLKIKDQINEGALKDSHGEDEIFNNLWKNISRRDINKILNVYPKAYRPSGGEKQRVLLAMAFKKIQLLRRAFPKSMSTFFVFDEPTGSLDDNYRNMFLYYLFSQYVQRPFTCQIITHDYSIISEVYKRYRDLLGDIYFKELVRVKNDDNVEVRNFSPREYGNWLQDILNRNVEMRSGDVVLDFKSDFKIFKRSLRVFGDAEGTIKKDLIIRRGEIAYVKAPSGVGKTTLAKVILGIYKAEKVTFTLSNVSFTEKSKESLWHKKIWGKKAGMIFQHADESLNLEATIKDSFSQLPLKKKISSKELIEYLGTLFDFKVDKKFIGKKIKHLSGGQKQRINILRTLILDTDLIILDEPLNGLDFVSVKKVLSLLEEKRGEGKAMLMISHNEEIFDALIGEELTYHLRQV